MKTALETMGMAPSEPPSGSRAKHLPQRRAPDLGGADFDPPVVLIVDDVPANLLALEGMLRRNDVEIVTALSGRAALDTLLARDVAVAIIDVQMPEMDGFELAVLMRGVQKTRFVPIVFVTAGSREPSRIFKGYESGAVDYLFKPIDEHVLRGKVDVFVTLEQHRQQLRHADRLREMFIGVLGHDLRNPLSGILMSAQILLQRSSDEAITVGMQRILRNGDRMVRMIDQLLDFSRFRVGRGISLSPKQADLRELTVQVLSEFEELRARFQIEVLGDTVGTWDADRVLQVVSNLVGNAVQHSPSGSPIGIRIQGRREDTVVFQVDNIGAPVPEELRDVLFEPFRGSEGGCRKTQRLGLGLFITRQIVLAHGGVISFESSEESGTCFTVSMPRHTIGGDDEAGVPSTVPACVVDAGVCAEKTILLVEEEQVARDALSRFLQDLGYQVLVASRPSEALKLVDRHDGPVHLLLADVWLPEMNGEELAARLRGSRPKLEAIFMSGFPEAASSGSVFLPKPIDFDALTEVIQRALVSVAHARGLQGFEREF
jgi:signal transduction histidine kinase